MKNNITNIEPQEIADTIADVQVQVVMATELPTSLQPPRDTYGVAGAAVTTTLRQWRREQDQPADDCEFLIINDPAILADITKHTHSRDGQRHVLFRECIVSTTIHELAHTVSLPPTTETKNSANLQSYTADQQDGYADWCRHKRNDMTRPIPPFIHHNAPFIRALLHILHRFHKRYQVSLPAWQLFDSDRYQFAGLWNYSQALDEEPHRLQNVPLTQLLNITPPKLFTNLHAVDVREWRRKHSPKRKTQCQSPCSKESNTFDPIAASTSKRWPVPLPLTTT